MNLTEQDTIAIGCPSSIMRRITEAPEPQAKRITHYSISTSTPWGSAQTATHFGCGIVQYSTASHGGFHVSAGLLKRMPDYLQTADSYASGTLGWFEEDCAWAIVVVCFPERFSQETRLEAIRTMQSIYPKQWARFAADPFATSEPCWKGGA